MGTKPVFEAAPRAAGNRDLRHDWKRAEVEAIYRSGLPELVFRAQTRHRQFHAPDRVQTCQLISIKTGGCPEDCAYCPQSARYDAGVGRQGLLDPQHVIEVAREAASRGVTRFCMGAAWRQAPEGRGFGKVLEMVRGGAGRRIAAVGGTNWPRSRRIRRAFRSICWCACEARGWPPCRRWIRWKWCGPSRRRGSSCLRRACGWPRDASSFLPKPSRFAFWPGRIRFLSGKNC